MKYLGLVILVFWSVTAKADDNLSPTGLQGTMVTKNEVTTWSLVHLEPGYWSLSLTQAISEQTDRLDDSTISTDSLRALTQRWSSFKTDDDQIELFVEKLAQLLWSHKLIDQFSVAKDVKTLTLVDLEEIDRKQLETLWQGPIFYGYQANRLHLHFEGEWLAWGQSKSGYWFAHGDPDSGQTILAFAPPLTAERKRTAEETGWKLRGDRAMTTLSRQLQTNDGQEEILGLVSPFVKQPKLGQIVTKVKK